MIKIKNSLTVVAILLTAIPGVVNGAPVQGEPSTFTSPSGLQEQCIRITPLPGAHYSKHDLKREKAYCKLDFYTLALCPKLWSTSPGTILYDIDAEAFGGDYAQFEKQHCGGGHHARSAALDKPATFKISVNDRDTSATYAPSSWVYYHLSRYFDTNTQVPVAVYRSMDKAEHHQRVVQPALGYTEGHRNLRMLAAGWRFLDQVESGGGTSASRRAALSDENRQVFGVLLDNKGDRYGPEINGTRESGWGVGQNLDFQQTAPFLALRSELSLNEAAKQAVHEARANPQMAKKLPADTSVKQVIFWMQDVAEIALLDYLLGQQDRIGNIDYSWRWYWLEDGELESEAAHGATAPESLQAFNPQRLRRSAINDNDAGVRRGYANFAKKAGMLDKLRHYPADLYQKLGLLAADFAAEGPIHGWLSGPAGLSKKELSAIATRTQEAFSLLQRDCNSGALKLDIDLAAVLAGRPPASASCEIALQ